MILQIICTVAVVLWAVMYLVGMIMEIMRYEREKNKSDKNQI